MLEEKYENRKTTQEAKETTEENEPIDEKTADKYVEYCRDGLKPTTTKETTEKIETGKLNYYHLPWIS